MATFTYEGSEVEFIADPSAWLLGEASTIKKHLGAAGLGEIAEAVKAMDPDALIAIACISIKRVTGTLPAFTDVAYGVSLGTLVDAMKDLVGDPADPTKAATPAWEAAI